MSPARTFLTCWLSAACLVACPSFDTHDPTAERDAGGDAASVDASVDAEGGVESDGPSPPVDAGVDANDIAPCDGGTLVFDDDLSGGAQWTGFAANCTQPSVTYGAGVTIDCDGPIEAFDTIHTTASVPEGAAVVVFGFTIQEPGDGGVAHVFAQLIGALGSNSNLTFSYDPQTSTVSATGGTAWSGVALGTAHTVRVRLPPIAGDGGPTGSIGLALDDQAGTSVLAARLDTALQFGPYLHFKPGHAKDRYDRARYWSCP